ncbi:MAG: methyltransferase [Acidobacteriia bacterium]|nr:methyltransferase [Terriglobia bacterium]
MTELVLPLPRPLRRAFGWASYLRFLLFQRHRHGHLVVEEVGGFPVLVLPHVFNPKLFHTGELLAASLDETVVRPGSSVLDLGTGSGVAAVAAARLGARVVAVDLNPHAVRCTRINALLNHVEGRVDARVGNLFAPVAGQRFDLVLFNPPYFRGTPRDLLDAAWRSEDVAERFAVGLAEHLAPGGRAIVVLSTDGDAPGFLAALASARLRTKVRRREELWHEVLTVFEVTA